VRSKAGTHTTRVETFYRGGVSDMRTVMDRHRLEAASLTSPTNAGRMLAAVQASAVPSLLTSRLHCVLINKRHKHARTCVAGSSPMSVPASSPPSPSAARCCCCCCCCCCCAALCFAALRRCQLDGRGRVCVPAA